VEEEKFSGSAFVHVWIKRHEYSITHGKACLAMFVSIALWNEDAMGLFEKRQS
jgi:hypothetical protein